MQFWNSFFLVIKYFHTGSLCFTLSISFVTRFAKKCLVHSQFNVYSSPPLDAYNNRLVFYSQKLNNLLSVCLTSMSAWVVCKWLRFAWTSRDSQRGTTTQLAMRISMPHFRICGIKKICLCHLLFSIFCRKLPATSWLPTTPIGILVVLIRSLWKTI